MRPSLLLLSAAAIALSTGLASAQTNTPRNLILFIPDGAIFHAEFSSSHDHKI